VTSSGPVESAIRRRFSPPEDLYTSVRKRPFRLSRIDRAGLALELGEKSAHTPISWTCLEGIPQFLRGRGWVRGGGIHSTESELGSLDEYLKHCVKRNTANWIAVVLAEAGVVEISKDRPFMVKLVATFETGAR
jgi:hypothetical protein